MRNPVLRSNANEWWEKQRREAEWGRTDEQLEEQAERIGMGIFKGDEEYEPGPLLVKIRTAVQELGKLAWGWQGGPTGEVEPPSTETRAESTERG